jgi:hypothetical protein
LPSSLHQAAPSKRPNLDKGFNPLALIILLSGTLYVISAQVF